MCVYRCVEVRCGRERERAQKKSAVEEELCARLARLDVAEHRCRRRC